MKYSFLLVLLLFSTFSFAQQTTKTENVILVTFDGYRWQELFGGAQRKIINKKKYAHDVAKLKAQYWDKDPAKRRQTVMPFFWGTIAKQGQIWGNRKIGNKVTLTNHFKFSYPGYNEIFCGWGDRRINSNDYGKVDSVTHVEDPNKNIFDFLSAQKGFEGKLAGVGTWDAFPRIIGEQRNHTPVFVNMKANATGGIKIKNVDFSTWQTTIPPHNPFAKMDTFTYKFAKEYLQRYHPRLTFIGFDETDDFAHDGNYPAYLGTANTLDAYMNDLWNFVQADPQYKDKTTIIITCDHGRGNYPPFEWRHHGYVPGAQFIWIAAIGPDIAPKGEIKTKSKHHQNQIAATVAQLLGYKYTTDHFVGEPFKELLEK